MGVRPGARCGEGGGVDAHGGREKLGIGGVGEVEVVAVHVLGGEVCLAERVGGGVGELCAGRGGGERCFYRGAWGDGHGAEGEVGEAYGRLGVEVRGKVRGGRASERTVRE